MKTKWMGMAALLATSWAAEATLAQAPSLRASEESARATRADAPFLAQSEPLARVDYDWTIRELDGEPIDLEEFRGKVLFINAWASWCVPCIREMASIERLAAGFSDAEVAFLLVAVEGERSVRRHIRRYPLTLPVFLEEQQFPRAFGLRGIPMSWIVDREGRIVFRHFGAADWDDPAVEAFLRGLLEAGGDQPRKD